VTPSAHSTIHAAGAGALQGGARRSYWLVLAALFLAGFSGLIYEVAWTRILSLTFGGTVIAGAAVLCSFMGGLALGSWASGRWADAGKPPALSLAAVQLAMAAVAVGLMPLFRWLTQAYVRLDWALHPSYQMLSALRFGLSVLVLLAPAGLIAAAFPLAVKLAASLHSRIGERVALVYGIDTMGGVAGAAVAGFLLLPALGVARTVHAAAGLNLVAALLALASRSAGAASERAGSSETPAEESRVAGPPSLGRGATHLLFWCFAASGAAALSYEVLTTKALVHLVTMSFEAFCTMLTCFLLGIGAGSLICMALIRDRRALLFRFALVEAGIGLVGLSLPLQLQWMPSLLALLEGRGYPQWSGAVSASAVVLLPLALLMGATLPLLVGALTPSLRHVGRSAGGLYSVNTLGGVMGVLVATFILLPGAGFKTGMAIAASANLLVALVALHYARDVPAKARLKTGLYVLAAAALLLPLSSRSSLQAALLWAAVRRPRPANSRVLFYKEGEYGTVAVARFNDSRVGFVEEMFVSASGEGGSDLGSLRAFQLLGNLPFLLHKDHTRPKSVLVCAFGMGITLGTAADQDSSSIECVELVPEVLEASRFFSPYNHDPLDNPRVRVHLEDARNFLLTTPNKYDIVIMDATHPRSGDSWMLYTRECYQLASRALAPGGVCAQWVPRHFLPAASFWSIVKTFQSVFPHATLWAPPRSTHTVLVGTPEPTKLDFGHLRARLKDAAVRRNLEAAEIADEYGLLSYFIAGEEALAKKSSPYPLNTDDLSPVQFAHGGPRSKHDEFLDLMESPLGMAVGLGAAPSERAACSERISRAFRAAKLTRQGLEMNAGRGPGAELRDEPALREAYRLNPNDRDLAVWLGFARPRLRAGATRADELGR